MNEIIRKVKLTSQIYLMDIFAPRIAAAAKPGQFVIVMTDEAGERIPLTICDYDIERGIITIVFQSIGKSTKLLAVKKENEFIYCVAGPLGQPSELININKEKLIEQDILFIGGGVGIAPIYIQLKWLHQRGIMADVVLGVKSQAAIILDKRVREAARNVYECTEDGSLGYKGFVTEKLVQLIESGQMYNRVIAIGPVMMMKAVCEVTNKYNINTTVSLNSLMLDGTGMCGACRVTVGGKVKFTCVDGPEFNGNLVDFDEVLNRQQIYKNEEAAVTTFHCDCNK